LIAKYSKPMRNVAIIPVKQKSERVEDKNFRDFFNGESLLDIKINQLKKENLFDEIYVSSDSKDAKKSCDKHGIKYLKRDISLCNNITPWSEVIFEVVNSIPEPDATNVAWCHTTSPLFNRFNSCLEKYKNILEKKEGNGVVAVSRCKEFIVDENATPVNYTWGPWHRYSQHLKKYYFISGALFLTTKNEMLKNRYVISTSPYLMEFTAEESIDIDTEFDYKYAQYVYSLNSLE